MKKHLRILLIGLLIVALCTGAAYAITGFQTIEVSYSDIKIVIDGKELDPRDPNGNVVEPFIYNGTTYLPVRAVGEAIGKNVSWDGVEKVVYLGVKPGEVQSWFDVCKPYQYSNLDKEYLFENNQFFTMSGMDYTNGFVLAPSAWDGHKAEALFNLNGQYSSVEFVVGHIDGSSERNATINIYLDGTIAYTTDIKYNDLAKRISVPLNGALQMRVEVVGHNLNVNNVSRCNYGFSDGVFS